MSWGRDVAGLSDAARSVPTAGNYFPLYLIRNIRSFSKAILELLRAPQWLMDAVEAHEARCSYAGLIELASRLEEEEEARKALVEVVEYDRAFRELVAEKGNVSKEMLDFLFGRPLMYTVIMFGIDARANADGSITLVQTTKATLKR